MANDTRTIAERIEAGKYANALQLPTRTTHGTAEACKTAREAYSVEDRRLRELFRADLEEDNGTSSDKIGQRKADLLWAHAWDHGHASGLHEVAYWYCDLAELVLPS